MKLVLGSEMSRSDLALDQYVAGVQDFYQISIMLPRSPAFDSSLVSGINLFAVARMREPRMTKSFTCSKSVVLFGGETASKECLCTSSDFGPDLVIRIQDLQVGTKLRQCCEARGELSSVWKDELVGE